MNSDEREVRPRVRNDRVSRIPISWAYCTCLTITAPEEPYNVGPHLNRDVFLRFFAYGKGSMSHFYIFGYVRNPVDICGPVASVAINRICRSQGQIERRRQGPLARRKNLATPERVTATIVADSVVAYARQ